jgi:hypothetical protein
LVGELTPPAPGVGGEPFVGLFGPGEGDPVEEVGVSLGGFDVVRAKAGVGGEEVVFLDGLERLPGDVAFAEELLADAPKNGVLAEAGEVLESIGIESEADGVVFEGVEDRLVAFEQRGGRDFDRLH